MKDLKNYEMDITINCYYASDLSQIYFDDNFEILQYSGHRTSSVLNFRDYGNLEKFDVDFSKLSKDDLLHLLNDDYCSLKDKKEYLINELLENYNNKEYNILLDCTKDQLNKLGFCAMYSRGHSQGDYANILINTKEYKKTFQKDFNEKEYQKYFDNLLWNSPININFKLRFYQDLDDGFKKEYIYNSFDNDLYSEEFMNNIYDIDTLDYKALINAIQKDLELSDTQIKLLEDKFSSLSYDDIKYN